MYECMYNMYACMYVCMYVCMYMSCSECYSLFSLSRSVRYVYMYVRKQLTYVCMYELCFIRQSGWLWWRGSQDHISHTAPAGITHTAITGTYIHTQCIHTYIFKLTFHSIHTFIYIHAYIQPHIHIRDAYIHTYLPTYIHAYIHTCIHTYMHTYLHTYLCVRL